MIEPVTLTRRTFLHGASVAAAALPLGLPRPMPAATASRKLKLLILGGTAFLGPAIVRAALERGHELTLFNRGRTRPELFPQAEKLRGNRRRPRKESDPPQDLTALQDRTWDAVVDTSGYYTGEVEDAAKLLASAVRQYVYISSLSCYRDMEATNATVSEDSPLCSGPDRYTLDMGRQFENYGALKAYCEEAVAKAFPGRATLVRPGYIVGPEDPTDRFTSWPARVLRGGECLAPGDPDAELQIIDVRDLGAWIVHLCENETTGPFNAVGFRGRISTQELLHTAKGTLNHECSFTWVDDAFLAENGVTSWEEMGCWTPAEKRNHATNDKALAAGLAFRPIAETIRDTAAWVQKERGDRPWRAGMKPEREAELLAKWRAKK